MASKKPVTRVYRILRNDMDGLKFVDHKAMQLYHDSNDFARGVYAVGHGIKRRAPFWHASISLNAAYVWRTFADSVGSQPSGHVKRVAIRIDIWAWFQSGTMHGQGGALTRQASLPRGVCPGKGLRRMALTRTLGLRRFGLLPRQR